MVLDSADFVFGSVLKAFRTRGQLTQQQLAAQLGVRRNTLGSWERGDFLPQSRGVVLELARCLHLNDQETRQLLEASLTALTPHWSVPFPRNPFFTGREEVLEALHAQLDAEQAVALTQSSALHGLGGVGKTQIALEYAYRHALDYSAIFWIGAETVEGITSSLLRIAEVLQLSGREDQNQQRVIERVQHWLSTHSQWLVIWDNIEDLDLLNRFLPPLRLGAVLITTRRRALGAHARGLGLLPMEQEEGVLFLLRRAKALDASASREQIQQFAHQMPAYYAAAVELVEVLGRLPLALDQAGAYVEETGCSLVDYLHRYQRQRTRLLDRRGWSSQQHPHSVTATFRLAMERLEREQPEATDLLRVCAFLHAEAIPEELFSEGALHLGPILAPLAIDPSLLDHAVAALRQFSLVRRQAETRTLSLHRLVQAVLLDTMSEGEQEHWKKCLIEALDAVFPEIPRATELLQRKHYDRLLPHALHCLRQMEPGEHSLTVASLVHKAAFALHVRAQYAEAEPLHRSALTIREQALGPEHPEVASSLHALALLCWRQGKYPEAESLYLRALQIREQVLGPGHREVANLLNDLGSLYWKQGKYSEAERVSLRALRIQEQVLGPDHPDVAIPLNTLMILYGQQGRLEQAEPLGLRALWIREHALEPDHPAVTISLSNLCNLYLEQKRYAQAEPLCLRALQISEQAQGSNHPDIAYPLLHLAELYQEQGKHVQAEPLYVRALQIREHTLGADHELVASPLQHLANLYREQGRYREAETLYHRALLIREQQLDPQHPQTAETLHGLALLRQQQGKVSEALCCAQRALAIRSHVLGEANSKTAATREFVAHLVQEHASAQREAVCQRCPEEIADPRDKERHEAAPPALSQGDLLQAFLDACCELHPRAWCRSADLWQAYGCWAEELQERYPLSRGAFIAQLKAHGCRADRTMTARIWRGIALVKKES